MLSSKYSSFGTNLKKEKLDEIGKKINSDEGVDEGATIQAKLIKDGKNK